MKIVHYYKVARHFSIFTHEFWLALCHDLVEDGYLHKYICRIWASLDAITRRKDEQYFDYIKRCKLNKTATNVKIMDLCENMKRCSISLKERYNKAHKILMNNKH